MRNFKKISLFLLLNISITLLLHFFLAAPCRQKIYIDQIHRGSYSTLVVGHSHAAAAINPYILDDKSGKVFNSSHLMTPVRNFYFQIQEANQANKLKRVLFELDVTYFCSDATGTLVGIGMNLFPYLSPEVQLSYLKDFLWDSDYNQVLFDYRINADTLRSIPNAVNIKLSSDYINSKDPVGIHNNDEHYDYMGRGFRYHDDYTYASYTPQKFDYNEFDAESLEYIHKSAEYCRENNIEMICFTPALPPFRLINENLGEVHDFFKQLCDSEGVPYYDFNYIKPEFLPRSDYDYVDQEGHMLGYLANRQTILLKEVLKSDSPEDYFEPNYKAVLEGLRK